MSPSTPALDPSQYPTYAAECGDPSRTKKLGFGARPAIILLDVCEAYFNASSPLALAADSLDRISHAIAALLLTCREGTATTDIPVIYAQTLYTHPQGRDAGLAALKSDFVAVFQAGHRSSLVALPHGHKRIHPRPNDLLLKKKYPSAFFGTNLSTQLAAMNIDTLIIGGLTTSLNVRATALDAMQSGFRAMVVAEACGDRRPEVHWANLMDVGAKYGDVVGVKETVAYLQSTSRPSLGEGPASHLPVAPA